MLFESVHIVFKDRTKFTDINPPAWLVYDGQSVLERRVKKLKVGGKMRTVSHTIKRIA